MGAKTNGKRWEELDSSFWQHLESINFDKHLKGASFIVLNVLSLKVLK